MSIGESVQTQADFGLLVELIPLITTVPPRKLLLGLNGRIVNFSKTPSGLLRSSVCGFCSQTA